MEQQSGSRVHPWQHFHGPNLGYVMELYEQYLQDPSSIDEELRGMFDAWGAPQVSNEEGTTISQAEPNDVQYSKTTKSRICG